MREPCSPLTIDLTIDWLSRASIEPVSDAHAGDVLRYALEREGQAGEWVLALRFTDDDGMIRLHETYMDDSSPTDILTFPYDEVDGGDIVISVETAARHASDAGWSTSDELDFLMLHGLLHILGWNDHDETERASMLDRQTQLLSGWRRSRE